MLGTRALYSGSLKPYRSFRRCLLFSLCIALLVFTLMPCMIIDTLSCNQEYQDSDLIGMYTIVSFSSLSLCFALVGAALLHTLLKTFPLFYRNVRTEIILTIVLTVTIFLFRTAWNFYLHYAVVWNKIYTESIENNTYMAPIYLVCFTVVVELLPVASLLVSLRFTFRERVKAIRMNRESGSNYISTVIEEQGGESFMWTDFKMNAYLSNSLSLQPMIFRDIERSSDGGSQLVVA